MYWPYCRLVTLGEKLKESEEGCVGSRGETSTSPSQIPSLPYNPKKMPATSSSVRKTTDLHMPTKSDGTKDKRYAAPQFVKKDGTRDMRTLRTTERK